MSTSLEYFLVTGHYFDVENPNPNTTSNETLFQIVTGVVTIYPRVPDGFVAYISDLTDTGVDTAVAIAPIQARILSGQLQTINVADTPNIHLLSNTAAISSQLATIDFLWPGWLEQNNLTPGQLVYDVQYTRIVYAEAARSLTSFAFEAPTDTTPVCLTDNNLARITYGG